MKSERKCLKNLPASHWGILYLFIVFINNCTKYRVITDSPGGAWRPWPYACLTDKVPPLQYTRRNIDIARIGYKLKKNKKKTLCS